jgi:hypothetical protein
MNKIQSKKILIRRMLCQDLMAPDRKELALMDEVLVHVDRDIQGQIEESSDLGVEDGVVVEVFGQHVGVQCHP